MNKKVSLLIYFLDNSTKVPSTNNLSQNNINNISTATPDSQLEEKNKKLQLYIALKNNFLAPTFPVFKPSCLRDFNFAKYLENCLLNSLRLFFRISWSCWIVGICAICLWGASIAAGSIGFSYFFMSFFPILGIFLNLAIYIYTNFKVNNIYLNTTQKVTYENLENSIDNHKEQGANYLTILIDQEDTKETCKYSFHQYNLF